MNPSDFASLTHSTFPGTDPVSLAKRSAMFSVQSAGEWLEFAQESHADATASLWRDVTTLEKLGPLADRKLTELEQHLGNGERQCLEAASRYRSAQNAIESARREIALMSLAHESRRKAHETE